MLPNATVSGSIEFMGRDLLALPESEVRKVRGSDIGDDLPGPRHLA